MTAAGPQLVQALLVGLGLIGGLGSLLALAARPSRRDDGEIERRLAARLDAVLPQTQCRQCGYEGCAPYALAIARGEAQINQCPPGGGATVISLARLTGQAPRPVDPACGKTVVPGVAVIDESVCIGCKLCIQACPVDAIVGAAKLMHTVIAQECTGCELCIPPCPVDCIDMIPNAGPPRLVDLPLGRLPAALGADPPASATTGRIGGPP